MIGNMTYDVALITGASSGIGEAFARALPRETALLLTGRDGARLTALAQELGNGGRRVETLAADLATEAGRDALIARAAELPVDLLINNAGLGRLGPLAESPVEAEREMVEVNVIAPLVLTRSLLPAMLARARANGRRAGIVIVASTAAYMPLPYLTTYAATKAFDRFFAEGLAGEMKKEPVDVLALCPGRTQTRFFERAGFLGRFSQNAMDPGRVAREALAALGKQTVVLPGANNKATALAARFLPRHLVLDGARSLLRREAKRNRR